MLESDPNDGQLYVGCDEAGRGSLISSVVAACVVWKPGEYDHLINDSKKLTSKMRKEMAAYIKDNAIDYAIAFVDEQRIDEVNILNASMEAMHKCLDQLTVNIDHILVDGNKFVQYKDKNHTCVVQGDGKYLSIAAASILAKVARDEYIGKLSQEYQEYGWDTNMGYGTKKHIMAIEKHGPTPYHRKTFIKNIYTY